MEPVGRALTLKEKVLGTWGLLGVHHAIIITSPVGSSGENPSGRYVCGSGASLHRPRPLDSGDDGPASEPCQMIAGFRVPIRVALKR